MKFVHPHNRLSKIHRSFTLIELTVVLVIVITTLSFGIVNLRGMMGSTQLSRATRQVYDALNQARSNAITMHRRTRVFFPCVTTNGTTNGTTTTNTSTAMGYTANTNNTMLSPYDATNLALYQNQSYIIADWTYDVLATPDAYRWIARTPWEFLPAGIVFDSDVRGGTGSTANITTNTNGGVWGSPGCVLVLGGQTAFQTFESITPSTTNWETVYYYAGAGTNKNQSVEFGLNPIDAASYIEFSPTGAYNYTPVGKAGGPSLTVAAIKICEGFYFPSGTKVNYSNVNSSSGPANYSLITIDKLTGRLRIKKPGGAAGGC